jgi:hypothetical protein
MKAIKSLLVLLLAVVGSDAFTTKKRERRPAFKSAPVSMEEQQTASASASATGNTAGAGPLFAMPSHSMASALMQPEDAEDELDIGYGTALVSCMLSLALGFGIGYGT